MNPQQAKQESFFLIPQRSSALVLVCLLAVFFSACTELKKPKTEHFYSETKPPRVQELRWTNGQLPKSFDPAMASAPPETDFVRALYEGLTDTESKTMEAIPATALEWSPSDNHRVWTFKLRNDAKWSNGEVIVAKDFVLSWRRLADMGDRIPHHELLKNIVGMGVENPNFYRKKVDVLHRRDLGENSKASDYGKKPNGKLIDGSLSGNNRKSEIKIGKKKTGVESELNEGKKIKKRERSEREELGVRAIGEFELEVSLVQPDREFPKLVAHPVFRPVYANGEEFEEDKLNPKIVTSGAFSIVSVSDDGVTLKQAENYWNKDQVKLERVRFVPTKDADSALQAYREGKVDAVTNAQFEPLALKLLTPYFDFHRITHSALNLYEFNLQKPPFNDRRVREALAISIDRERLTEDEMDGATRPAYKYLPFSSGKKDNKLDWDIDKARELMKTAGFQNGENFPKVRLVINRNNVQQRIAKSVKKMWKEALDIDTEIVVKELGELKRAKKERDFDVLRRGVVLPTADETANMLAIFKPTKLSGKDSISPDSSKPKNQADTAKRNPANAGARIDVDESTNAKQVPDNLSVWGVDELIIDVGENYYLLTEEEALIEVPGIPLYFPTSYSLVKPYVIGFEINAFDGLSLKEVEIDSNWQPKNEKGE